MRGVPGSGKSTRARVLAGDNGRIHSTDDYFMVRGEYCFDGSLLAAYHERNFQAFTESLRQGIPVVVCDNVNAKRDHFVRYAEAAIQAGYVVRIEKLPHPSPEVAASRSAHRVPVRTIERTIAHWEP